MVPGIGTTSQAHPDENLAAINMTFSAAELSEFNTTLSGIVVQGERLRDSLLQMSRVEAALTDSR